MWTIFVLFIKTGAFRSFAYLLLDGRLYFCSFSVIQGLRKCRGSILTKSMVLTAAHCLIKVDSDESVSTASAAYITVQHGKNCCCFFPATVWNSR